MALIKKPVTGMRDILPDEMAIRQYAMSVIRDTYRSFGFTEIETPVVESLSNLCSNQGGDNEKLIFRILKRGEKLDIANASSQDDLTDSGLRYDLTVPLVRYYSNHMNELPSPFKALQMGNVFRADRPQKGRYRQFMQCDIDIFGEEGTIAEIELILAITTVLGRLGFKGFQVRINDRRLLKITAAYCGFKPEMFDSVFIALDKLDKIGFDGVKAELIEITSDEEASDKCVNLLKKFAETSEGNRAFDNVKSFCSYIQSEAAAEVSEDLISIIEASEASKGADFDIIFDPTLVRGMGYYTGTIFEIAMPRYGGSCGGGGRYDEMVGKFTGQAAPACGFSIGFERIIMLMMEEGFKIPSVSKNKAYLIEKGVSKERLAEIIKRAAGERSEGLNILTVYMNKNKKFQKEQLMKLGYSEFEEFYKEELKEKK